MTNMKLKSRMPARRSYSQTARAQAAEETGKRIVDAFVARLMSQWFDEITLDSVAADAGVTVQTVIRRFGGKEGLLAEAVVVIGQQVNAERGTPSGDIAAVVDRLYADYEKTGDAIIRLLSLEARQPAIERLTEFGRGEHRQWVCNCFAESLAKVTPAQRQGVVDALVIATDVYSWKLLRRDMGRSLSAAKAITRSMVQSTIASV